MNPVLTAVVLMLVVVAGSYTSFRKFPGVETIYLFGTEFFLVGIALGDATTGILNQATLYALEPVFGLALAWIGLLYGLQLNLRHLTGISWRYYVGAGLKFALTGTAVFFALGELPGLFGMPPLLTRPARLVLSAALTPAALPFLMRLYRTGCVGVRREVDGARYIAALDDLYPLTALALFAMVPSLGGESIPAILHIEEICAVTAANLLATALVTAGVLTLLAVRLLRSEEFFLVVLSAVLLAAGLSAALRLSPLVAGVLAGFLVANVSAQKERIASQLSTVEKPIYLLLLLMMGAYLTFDFPLAEAMLLVFGVFLARFVATLTSGGVLTRLRLLPGSGRNAGSLFLPVSSMSVAMAGAYCLADPAAGQPVALVTLFVLLLSDGTTPWVARRIARRRAS